MIFKRRFAFWKIGHFGRVNLERSETVITHALENLFAMF